MNFNKNLVLWVIIVLLGVMLYTLYMNTTQQKETSAITFSEFMGDVDQKQIKDATIQGQAVTGHMVDDKKYSTYLPPEANVIQKLHDAGVNITALPAAEEQSSFWTSLLVWFPIILAVGGLFFIMRQMQAGGGKAMGFGKSRARLLTEKSGRVTFDDVAGIDEAKQELEEIVDFLKDPSKFQKLGGKIPKGVLLAGPPGTGKTLLARAIAGEANVPFFSISGSDFVEMFVGVGASRVRDMFEQGKKNAPCIIFIDEIDAVGRHRGAGWGGGNDEREQTLNQLLVEMDGFESNEGVILIAATNRPDVLDQALLRPGRFDRQVAVPNPDINGREQILKVHLRKVPMAPDVDPRVIARGTPGFSGADLANLVNEAALLAARTDKKVINMRDLEAAKDKVMMGSERRSMIMSDAEKKLTAYHEAGHALVMIHLPAHDPVHKVTIIPRGRALGVTWYLPEQDRYSISKGQIKAQLAGLFGGRCAEELIFGEDAVTTGASNDIMRATEIARKMVTEFGFSTKLGPLRYSDNQEEMMMGHGMPQQKHFSDATTKVIDEEVRAFVEAGEHTARHILTTYKDQLVIIAEGLLEYETLSREDIDILLSGQKLVRIEEAYIPPSRRSKLPSSEPQSNAPDSKSIDQGGGLSPQQGLS